MKSSAAVVNADRLLPRPGLRLGPRPERTRPHAPWWAELPAAAAGHLSRMARGRAGDGRLLAAFGAADEAMHRRLRAGETLDELAVEAGRRLIRHGFCLDAVAQAQALAVHAVTGRLGLVPYPVQRCAAYHLLQSRLVELDTGEGKSISLLLAAAVAALAGVPTHVITANEALAQRDAQRAHSVLEALGLAAAAVTHELDDVGRRTAYACDVVYSTPQQIGFDYLRDRRAEAQGRPGVMRGLCLALLDEADNVLLDHARMPLVLAEQAPARWSAALLARGRELALSLDEGRDFHIDKAARRAVLAPVCEQRLAELFRGAGAPHDDPRTLSHLLSASLVARHALQRDVDYLVRDGAIELIDPATGRVQPDTRLSHGLHSALCAKEGVAPAAETRHTGEISIHRLVARYCLVGGISGTLRESRLQLWWFHRLSVHRLAPRVASRRRHAGQRVYVSQSLQLEAVSKAAREARDAGRPVLVGTDTVAGAERLSQALAQAGVVHASLTARDEAAETQRLAVAGHPGVVTVSTHLAGRGSDIALTRDSLAAGGLHVICCTCHGSARIERQLYGRAARNGQPGSSEAILSLSDRGFTDAVPATLLRLVARSADADGVLPSFIARVLTRWVNVRAETNDALHRSRALRLEQLHMDRLPYGLPVD